MSNKRLLPVGSSLLEVAAARAAADIERVPVPLRTLWNWRTCPVRLLPYLAWAFSVDRWEMCIRDRDDILMTVMLWRLDAGDITGAVEIARYALRFDLSMPENHSRPAPYMLAEEVALAALRARIAGEPVDASQLLEVIGLTDAADMPDEVRARLHKVTGLTLRDAGQLPDALAHLQRALQLDTNAGVRKDIETLTRELNPKPVVVKKTAPKAAKKAPAKKQDSPVKRGRGRPKKVTG